MNRNDPCSLQTNGTLVVTGCSNVLEDVGCVRVILFSLDCVPVMVSCVLVCDAVTSGDADIDNGCVADIVTVKLTLPDSVCDDASFDSDVEELTVKDGASEGDVGCVALMLRDRDTDTFREYDKDAMAADSDSVREGVLVKVEDRDALDSVHDRVPEAAHTEVDALVELPTNETEVVGEMVTSVVGVTENEVEVEGLDKLVFVCVAEMLEDGLLEADCDGLVEVVWGGVSVAEVPCVAVVDGLRGVADGVTVDDGETVLGDTVSPLRERDPTELVPDTAMCADVVCPADTDGWCVGVNDALGVWEHDNVVLLPDLVNVTERETERF